MKNHTIPQRVKYAGGARIRMDVDDFVHESAAKLQKRVSERAEDFETSGDPADVIAKAALTKCGDQRVKLLADFHAFLDIRDGRCGLELQPPKTIDEIDRQIEESQPYIEMFERDLLEVVTLAVVEYRASRNNSAPNN